MSPSSPYQLVSFLVLLFLSACCAFPRNCGHLFATPRSRILPSYSLDTKLLMNHLDQEPSERFPSRRHLVQKVIHNSLAIATAVSVFASIPVGCPSACAFEGGVGGVGKTKPETGVDFLSPATQDARGLVTAELLVEGQALRVDLQSPWPLLPTTTGYEVRDLQNPESAFLQIVNSKDLMTGPLSKKLVKQVVLQENILSSQGKYGAYGAPTDVKVQQVEEGNSVLWLATFTTLTPGLRESDRRVFLKCYNAGRGTWLVLVCGTTLLRFGKQEKELRKAVDSFQVVATPNTRLNVTPRNKERKL